MKKHHCRERKSSHLILLQSAPGIVAELLVTALATGLLLLSGLGAQIGAQEIILLEYPFPSSVDEDVTPIEVSFRERIFPSPTFLSLKQQLKDAPDFFRDTQLDFNTRSYYFYRERFDDTVAEAWAMGGALSYRSGWFLDRFGMGAAFYTAQRLYGPKDRDGTLLLKPGQHGYTVVGQIYGKVKLFEDHFLNLYRYEYNTPFINKNDSRMTPNTFEGYTFQGTFGGGDGAPGFQYVGGDPATKNRVPNENEFDADLQWRPTWSFLRGFSARFRYARVHQYQGPRDTLNEHRAIFNYDFGLL